jgi:kynurenine formamidase
MTTTAMCSSSPNTDSVIDLSHALDNHIHVYPGDPPFSCTPHITVSKHGCSVHALALLSHAGTHIDAPSHFFDRLPNIDQLPLSTFLRPAVILDVSQKRAREPISWADVSALVDVDANAAPERERCGRLRLEPGTAVLMFTGWSKFWGTEQYFDHPWIEREVAERLVAMGVTVIGSDTMSPDQMPRVQSGEVLPETGFGVHEVVLGAGGVIAENLTNLDKLKEIQDGAEGTIMVNLVPLKIAGCDGSPVRAFAWKK